MRSLVFPLQAIRHCRYRRQVVRRHLTRFVWAGSVVAELDRAIFLNPDSGVLNISNKIVWYTIVLIWNTIYIDSRGLTGV
ncbi:hypothetical protein ACFS07_01990 [Undibacterium arcticum]